MLTFEYYYVLYVNFISILLYSMYLMHTLTGQCMQNLSPLKDCVWKSTVVLSKDQIRISRQLEKGSSKHIACARAAILSVTVYSKPN